MSRQWKAGKKSVELGAPVRGSRIRRDPVTAAKPAEANPKAQWESGEWEVRLAILGIVAFALAINIITLAISAYTN